MVQQFILLLLRIPKKRREVDRALGDAAKKIEDRMVPKGPNVVRHLALPLEGKSEEWILQEMENMDAEMNGKQSAWKKGKLSGAVYRAYYAHLVNDHLVDSTLFVTQTVEMTWSP